MHERYGSITKMGCALTELSQSHHNRLDDYELTLISLCVCCIRYVGCIYSLMEKI
jgi:hypothetical protein